MTIEQKALVQIARQMNELFVIPASTDKLLAPILELIPDLSATFTQPAEAFCSNIRSVIATAGLPYTFALAASHKRRFQLLHCAAELEAALRSEGQLQPVSNPSESPEVDAQRRIQDLEQSKEFRDAMNYEACQLLLGMGQTEEMAEAATQLVLQATILTWGAFEVLSRDIFCSCLNVAPQTYVGLLADPEMRKRFDLSRISIEKVAELGFDLSKRLGDLFIAQNDLADLGGIKAAFFALFPVDSRLRTALNDRNIWLLFQRRHLIVHRRGIVDRQYVESSGDKLPVGSLLKIRPGELATYLQLVTTAAQALLSATRSLAL